MPVYEYQCKACGHVFDREHAIGEKKKYRCPDCSSAQTQKLISHVGVIFKGSGFYATDNRKGNGSNSMSGSSSGPSSHSSGSSAKRKSSDSQSSVGTDSGDSSKKDPGDRDSAKKDSTQKDSDITSKTCPASEN